MVTKHVRAGRENSCGANSAPNDARGGKGARGWTGEPVLRGLRADVRDIGEQPILDTDNGEATHKHGDNLDDEHHAWGNLHVVAELKVAGKLHGLCRANQGDGLENHVGDGTTREDVTRQQLLHDLERHLLVGNRLDHGEGDG